MTRTQTILTIVSALLLGGLAGSAITTHHLRNKRRGEVAMHNLFSSQFLLDQIELMDQSETDTVKRNMECNLVGGVSIAETFATRNDISGEISQLLLKKVADHRTKPSYIQAELAVRQMHEKFQKIAK